MPADTVQVAVTGASGLLGSALVAALRADRTDVLRLVRREPRAADEVHWDPGAGSAGASGAASLEALAGALTGVDAVVHLAGAGVGDRRWTRAYKQEIRDSRVQGTHTLASALAHTQARMDQRPRVLLSSSAIGYYGDTDTTAVDETAPPGSTFLAGVCREWEAATAPAQAAGVRVVHLRTGLVMGRSGGAFARLLPLLRLGLAGPLGSGRQYWSWITLEDEVRAIRFLLGAGAEVAGPVNLTAPQPVPQRELVAAFARVARRPALLPAPAPALRLALGEFAGEILRSQRVLPARLQGAGFTFRFPDVAGAARALLG